MHDWNRINIIHKNKAKPLLTIAGCLEYMELAKRFNKNILGPISPEESNRFEDEAEKIYEELFTPGDNKKG